ncbi:hypothetical protein ACHAXT_004265 [Thalassiosira profunda]
MPRGVKKENLPTKVCVTCGRPFTWRKKWERVWDEVSTCSKSCNKKRRAKSRGNAPELDAGSGAEEALAAGLDAIVVGEAGFAGGNCCAEEDDASMLASSENASPAPSDGGLQALQNERASHDELSDDEEQPSEETPPVLDAKAQRKADKKARKAARRAQREGRGDPTAGQKPCDLCQKSVNLLIRCTYDASGEWGMVCGKCWTDVSGGVVDGDDAHPHYRYGGLWKNRRAQT